MVDLHGAYHNMTPEQQQQVHGVAYDSAVKTANSIDWDAHLATLRAQGAQACGAVRRGDVTTQTLCFCGGVALTVLSFCHLLDVMEILSPTTYVNYMYSMIFGIIMMIYEWPLGYELGGLEDKLKTFQRVCDVWCKLFTSLIGRGMLYFLYGSSLNAGLSLHSDWPLWCASFYVGCCGLFLLVKAIIVSRDLSTVRRMLRRKYSGDQRRDLKDLFDRYDTQRRGYLIKEELNYLVNSEVGSSDPNAAKMGPEELNLCFRTFDRDNNGTVTFDEFWAWFCYQEGDIEKKAYETFGAPPSPVGHSHPHITGI